jgi:small subunit ribosomal protein S13
MFFFIDSLIPFRKKNKKFSLKEANLLQLLINRVGIGHSVALLIIKHLGYHPSIRISNLMDSRSYLLFKLRSFFTDNKLFLDKNIKEFEYSTIYKYIDLGSNKGIRHRLRYPVHGQRTRSNAKTRRRFIIKFKNQSKK